MDSVWLLILVMPLLSLSVWQVAATKPEPRRRTLRIMAVVGGGLTLLFAVVKVVAVLL